MPDFKAVDSFTVYGDPFYGDCSVTIFVNQIAPYNIKSIASPPTSQDLGSISNSRAYSDGDVVDQFCDGTTRVRSIARNNWPYIEIEVETSSETCGFNGDGEIGECTLFIDQVNIVSPGTIEIIPEGFSPEFPPEDYNPEYSLDGEDFQEENVFSGLAPGTYTAYARSGDGCMATKTFTIPEDGQTLLQINSINVVDEQNEFASDGSATVNAVSSSGPIEYSLNNLTWQSSNIFNNLAPGTYTAYAKDTLSTKSRTFSIKAFNGFVNQTPDIEVSEDNISKWLAVHNPLIFKFRRNDYEIAGIIAYPNDAALDKKPTLILKSVPLAVEVGGSIVVRSEKYNGVFKVLAYSGTNVTIDTKWITSTYTTGYVLTNAKSNYRVELRVVTGIGPEKDITLGSFTPDTFGLVTAQLQSKLKNLVNNKNEFLYDQINWRDLNAAGSFELYYRESWDSHDGEEWTKINGAFYFTNSAKQLGDRFGNNMGEYVLFPSYPVNVAKAKFLTTFRVPTCFIGYPFDLSFIYSEKVLGYQLQRLERLLDVNNNIIGTPTHTIMLNQDGSALLNQDDTFMLIEEGYEGFTPLSMALGIHRLMLSNVLLANTFYKDVQLLYQDEEGDHAITETKKIIVNNDCRVNPIYLAWVNTLGGWDYWLFEKTQKVNLGTGNIKTSDVYVEDLTKATGTTETVSKQAADKVTLGATVDIETFNAVRGVIYSPKVLKLVNQDPVKWVTVQVEQTSVSYETKDSTADIEFSIILPEINIQSN